MQKIGQYVLVPDNDKKILLLQRRKSQIWSLPGGRLNSGEGDWHKALAREILEETGLSVRNLKPFEVKLIEDPYQIKYCVYFIANPNDRLNIRLSNEHINYKWVDLKTLTNLELDDEPKVREVLEKYFTSS